MATTQPNRHRFELRAEPGHHTLVRLDGHEIGPKLTGVQIGVDPLQGTRVALEVHPAALDAVEFDGVAQVQINTYAETPGPAAAVFLSALDAELVEKAALARVDLGNEPHDGTRAILATLIEWANGEGGV